MSGPVVTLSQREAAWDAGWDAGDYDSHDTPSVFRGKDNPYLHPLKPELAEAWGDGYLVGYVDGIDARRTAGEWI